MQYADRPENFPISFSFPVAVITVASLLMSEQADAGACLDIGDVLLLVPTAIATLRLIPMIGAIRMHGIPVLDQ